MSTQSVELWWGIAGMSPSGMGSYNYWSSFRIVVENIAYEKVVGIWGRSSSGSTWDFYPASFDRSLGQNRELWIASVTVPLDEFVVKYDVAGTTTWDNNNWHNYQLDSVAAQSTDGIGTAVIGRCVLSQDNALISSNKLNFGISLQNLYFSKTVGIRFTTDNWATYQDAFATYQRSYPPYGLPYQPNVESWRIDNLPVGTVSDIEFAVFFDGYWDNNFEQNYHAYAVTASAKKSKVSESATGKIATKAPSIWDSKRIKKKGEVRTAEILLEPELVS